jgi:hypothetical protein
MKANHLTLFTEMTAAYFENVRERKHTVFQKGPFYFEIKVFNHLPTGIKKASHDVNQFISVLKSLLIIN